MAELVLVIVPGRPLSLRRLTTAVGWHQVMVICGLVRKNTGINLITALPRATTKRFTNQEAMDGGSTLPNHLIINTGIMLEHISNGLIPTGMWPLMKVRLMEGCPWSSTTNSMDDTFLHCQATLMRAPTTYANHSCWSALDQVLYMIR